jgi:serine/threonine protein kinase
MWFVLYLIFSHRDIKPENILLTEAAIRPPSRRIFKEPKFNSSEPLIALTDFGFAKQTVKSSDPKVGSFYHVPPEVAEQLQLPKGQEINLDIDCQAHDVVFLSLVIF